MKDAKRDWLGSTKEDWAKAKEEAKNKRTELIVNLPGCRVTIERINDDAIDTIDYVKTNPDTSVVISDNLTITRLVSDMGPSGDCGFDVKGRGPSIRTGGTR